MELHIWFTAFNNLDMVLFNRTLNGILQVDGRRMITLHFVIFNLVSGPRILWFTIVSWCLDLLVRRRDAIEDQIHGETLLWRMRVVACDLCRMSGCCGDSAVNLHSWYLLGSVDSTVYDFGFGYLCTTFISSLVFIVARPIQLRLSGFRTSHGIRFFAWIPL